MLNDPARHSGPDVRSGSR